MGRIGVVSVLANPSADEAPLTGWAKRAAAAHKNAVENLVLFVGAVALAAATGTLETPIVVGGAGVYLVARVAHAAIYIAGVPVARTLAFAAGWAGTLAIVIGALR